MAEITIELRVDAATRKKTIVIRYRADPGALPMEHEDGHRRIVDALIERGVVGAHELCGIAIEREGEAPVVLDAGDRVIAASEGQKRDA